MANVPELTNTEFENFIKEGIVLIDFSAEWCMPCVIMGPIVDELSEEFRGKIKFGKINIGENHKLARKFDVNSIPNFILFKDGKIAGRFIGSMFAEEFEEKLKGFL